VAFTFAWTRRLVEARAWQYEVWSGAKPPELENLRFLAGYRRPWRLRFDIDVLWPEAGQADPNAATDAFAFLRTGKVNRADLVWLCDSMVIEIGAPAMSMDLSRPGPAERLLLNRVRQELGEALYPNEDRSAVPGDLVR
jgi:hypothetical protein